MADGGEARPTSRRPTARHELLRYRALVESSMDAVLVTTAEGSIVTANAASVAMFGYTEAELLTMRQQDLVDESDERVGAMRATWQRDGRARGEITMRRKDGTRFPAEASAASFRDDGGLAWTSLFVRDLTEKKRDEAERARLAANLEAERRWLKAVLDHVPLATLLFTKDGYVHCNDRAEELFGARPSPELGSAQYLGRVLSSDGIPLSREELLSTRALDGKTTLAEAVIVERPDGSRTPVLASAAPIRDTSGAIIGAVGVVQDMSERLAAEAALRVALRSRERLIAIVTHDLRNHLNAVGLHARVVQTATREPEARESVVAIGRQLAKVKALIDDLVDVAQIENKSFAVQPRDVDVHHLLAAFVDAEREEEPRRDLVLDVPDGAMPARVDRARLVRALQKLVANARRFTFEGARIRVGARQSDEETLFWVADTGAGIPPDDLAHLFDMTERRVARDPRAAGLGLGVVRGIVEAHGGRIWAESAVGEGTTVYFAVPSPERHFRFATSLQQRNPVS